MLRTEGIILKETKYGETSKILSVYTEKLGKISVMVKGAYKAKSKYIANTQAFSLNDFQLRKGKNFYYISDIDLIDSFYNIREDYERVIYGYYLLELVDKSVPLDQENSKLYKLLKKGLEVLNDSESKYINLILGYEIKFISFLGYRPVLDTCINCGEKKLTSLKFSIENGGLLCQKCFGLDRYSIAISQEIYVIIYKALYSSLEDLRNIEGSSEDFYKAHNLLVDYILYSIDRKKFNSLLFLETII